MTRPAVLDDLDWFPDALATITGLAHAQATVTADDLRRELRAPQHPNHIGQAFSAARAAGVIRPVGYRTSNTPTRKNGVLRVWERHERNAQ